MTLSRPSRGLLTHLAAMSDDTGLFQHARWHIPDRRHGYCTDDNARALLIGGRLANLRALDAAETRLLRTYAAFVDHAFDDETGRFRNFMRYDRSWIEGEPDADAGARTLWALGAICARPPSADLLPWAGNLLIRAAAPLMESMSPRVWAFAYLGLHEARESAAEWPEAASFRRELAERLLDRWRAAARPDWPWFEDTLGYDNARLAEAAIVAGEAEAMPELGRAGGVALNALWDWQMEDGLFHPVGHSSFGRIRRAPARFDQQPA